MIRLLYGSDKDKIRKIRESLILDYQNLHMSSVVNLHNSILESTSVLQNAQSISFFGDRYIYLLNQENIFLVPDKEVMQALYDSPHLFIIELDTLLAEGQKIYKSIGINPEEYKKLKGAETFNPFLLTDSLWARDKKNLWRHYIDNLKKGESGEAIQGRIIWAMKMLVLFLQNPSMGPAELGITPFVYQKLQRNKSAFTKSEALDLYRAFLYSTDSGFDTSLVLEKIILEKV